MPDAENDALSRIADAVTDDAHDTIRENVAGHREHGDGWQRTPNRHTHLRAVLAELDDGLARTVEALPIRYCREDPTGVVLVNVSRDAVLDAIKTRVTPPAKGEAL